MLVNLVLSRYYLIVGQTPIYELLERLSNLLRAEEREAGARDSLQPAQLSVLYYLSRCNRYSDTPAAVTEYLGVTKGTASQTVMALDKRGFVEKRPDPGDGRVTRLRLTAAGRRLAAEALPPEVFRDTLGALSPARAAKLEGALRDLLTQLLRARDGRSFGVCKSCRYFRQEAAGFRCGLTEEPLEPAESEKICREHEAA